MTNDKHKNPVCHCHAYEWPHRWLSGKCKVDLPVPLAQQKPQLLKDKK